MPARLYEFALSSRLVLLEASWIHVGGTVPDWSVKEYDSVASQLGLWVVAKCIFAGIGS